VESAYTRSGEEPAVPPTPAEYDRSENPDRAFQRERVSLGFYASLSATETPSSCRTRNRTPTHLRVRAIPTGHTDNPMTGDPQSTPKISRGSLRARFLLLGEEEEWDDVLYRGW